LTLQTPIVDTPRSVFQGELCEPVQATFQYLRGLPRNLLIMNDNSGRVSVDLSFGIISRCSRPLLPDWICINCKYGNSMEQTPFWEADSHSAKQEITHLSWNRKVHYSLHKGPNCNYV